MLKPIRLRLNEREYRLDIAEQTLALDWIRGEAGLKGTKEGCREGDCGACLVLLGGADAAGSMDWRPVTSCTLAMGELDGRHVVTIEGLASAGLTPVMEAMLHEGASQCGFCSPGFVVALTGFLLGGHSVDPVSVMASVEGNLCRCTGYGSIRRACETLAAAFQDLPRGLEARLAALAERGVIPKPLAALMLLPPQAASPRQSQESDTGALELGGGTDYFVQHPDPDPNLAPRFSDHDPKARLISAEVGGNRIRLGAAVSVSEFFASPIVRRAAPGIERFEEDIASPPIRNRATIAGNVGNASPIADMTAMLLALDATVHIDGSTRRELPLSELFLSYKRLALAQGERIAALSFSSEPVRFNFEKAAKRARLDIATVNTALAARTAPDGRIAWAGFSLGGAAPVPLRLRAAEECMLGRRPSAGLAREVASLAMKEAAPISDVRGSSSYRLRLIERLSWAHFIRLWPQLELEKELLS